MYNRRDCADYVVLTRFRGQGYNGRGNKISVTDCVFMLLQVVAIADCVQHEVLSASIAYKRHNKCRPLGLRESEIVSNPRTACRAVADISALSNAIGEVGFLEQDN